MTWNVKHVWGLKKSYDDPVIRQLILRTVVTGLDTYFKTWRVDYKNVCDQLSNELNELGLT